MSLFHIITRKLARWEDDLGQQNFGESSIVPASYWDSSMRADEKERWVILSSFLAPANDAAAAPLHKLLSSDGSSSSPSICLFKEGEHESERFGMILGKECSGAIGVLHVLAVEEHPHHYFDPLSQGFDLCVARRISQIPAKAENGHALEVLRFATRVAIGSPCGLPSRWGKGSWEVAFYALRYPQARGVEGLQTSGECPWEGSIQFNSKCFLQLGGNTSAQKLHFFDANAACRGHAEGMGYATEDTSLAIIDNDVELKLLGVSNDSAFV